MEDPTMAVSGNRVANIGFMAGGAIIGLVLAWVAPMVQAHWSPVLLFPIVAGVALGLGVRQAARGWPDVKRGTILAAAVIGGLVLAGGQHYFAYRQYQARFEQSRLRNPQAQLVELAFGDQKPMGFGEFLKYSARERSFGKWQMRGWVVWASWVVDGVLMVLGGVGVVGFGGRPRR